MLDFAPMFHFRQEFELRTFNNAIVENSNENILQNLKKYVHPEVMKHHMHISQRVDHHRSQYSWKIPGTGVVPKAENRPIKITEPS